MTAEKVDKKKEEQTKKAQQKYMELQMLDQQMKHMQKQVEAIERQVMELEEVQLNLDELSKSKKGAEMWVPLASGIFVKTRLEDNQQLAVNAGSNTVVAKDIPATKAMLAAQATDMRNYQAEMVEQFEKIAEHAAALQQELQELLGA